MFHTYQFDQLPLDREVFMMDERWRADWESAQQEMVQGRGDGIVGFISYVAVRRCGSDSASLSWYPNITDRFHELGIRLPRTAFVTCVSVPGWDVKPHIFVNSEWLNSLHFRPYTAFALVDAIGVRAALAAGALGGKALVRLRDRIDQIASENPQVAFLSFADSLLLKVNWFVGQFGSAVRYSYEPEILVRLLPTIAAAFEKEIGLPVYTAITQGANEYEDSELLHFSERRNHVSLNSLGLPFAQLQAIDGAARAAIRAGRHPKAELYMDECFFRSLRLRYGFDKKALSTGIYKAPLSSEDAEYVCADCATILENLDNEKSQSA
ncbi:MAG: hypothetical protein ABL961_00820 [Vicinamibacterales bacterium]